MTQIDVDSCEYCHLCSEPVALIETKDVHAMTKASTVTTKLAERAHLEAYLVEYELNGDRGSCSACGRAEPAAHEDIVKFFVTEWTGSAYEREPLDPKPFAEWLWSLRFPHWQSECSNPRSAAMLYEEGRAA